MRIIEPHFSLTVMGEPLTPEKGIELLKFVEAQARISHAAQEKQTEESWQRFIPAVVLQHGDWSVTEAASVTALFRIDRGTSAQLCRHRLFSFTEASTRFINFRKVGEIDVIKPDGLTPELESVWLESVSKACWGYTLMMERGAKPETARSVLPLSLATTISVTGNLRNWRSFFMLRCTKETQPDMKRITLPMLMEFKRCIPFIYTDLDIDIKQSISLARAR